MMICSTKIRCCDAGPTREETQTHERRAKLPPPVDTSDILSTRRARHPNTYSLEDVQVADLAVTIHSARVNVSHRRQSSSALTSAA